MFGNLYKFLDYHGLCAKINTKKVLFFFFNYYLNIRFYNKLLTSYSNWYITNYFYLFFNL